MGSLTSTAELKRPMLLVALNSGSHFKLTLRVPAALWPSQDPSASQPPLLHPPRKLRSWATAFPGPRKVTNA